MVEPSWGAYLPTDWFCVNKYLGVGKTDHMHKPQGMTNCCDGSVDNWLIKTVLNLKTKLYCINTQ